MSPRLRILFVSPLPPSPPTFGAQRRMQGLMASLARSHHIDAISFVPSYLDIDLAERAMSEYCRKVVLVSSGAATGVEKRGAQLASLLSSRSFEYRQFSAPNFQGELDVLCDGQPYDVINVEFCFVLHCRFRTAPGGRRPLLVLDEHNIEYDLARQMTGLGRGFGRHIYNSINWRKIRREEIAAWQRADGVAFTSALDEQRARAQVPSLRSCVVPNAVDIDFFRPRPGDPPCDGHTVLFFGTFNYFPNRDGVLFFLRDVWPRLAADHPQARLKVVGADPPPEVLAQRGPRVEITGQVDDVRPHLAQAAVAIAPLRIGGGTRLKIVEAMAMAKPVVSTSLGAEGIGAAPGREILIADEASAFASAVGRILTDRSLGEAMGKAARALVERHYSWDIAATKLESFYRDLVRPGSS
jgi:polysaccharide biosynthesis protein PslH